MSNEKMLEEFEAWAAPIGFDVDYIYADDAFKCYCFTATQNVFEIWKAGWKASRASLCVNLPDSERSVDCGYVLYRSGVEQALDSAGVRYK